MIILHHCIAKEIDAVKILPTLNKPVVFSNIDKKKKYFTQCIIVNNLKGDVSFLCMIDRTIEDWYYLHWLFKEEMLDLELPCFCYVFVFDSFHCVPIVYEVLEWTKENNIVIIRYLVYYRYDVDEMEKTGLLRRKVVAWYILVTVE